MKMYPARTRLMALNVAVAALQGGDLFGVSRTVDHAVYTLLNAVAVILWRLNAAIISISMFGYVTQDWLTNRHDGGVWHVLGMIAGPDGLAGETVWAAMLALALALFGLARVARPFMRSFNPVDLGKLLMFGVLSYAVIQQGSGLMIAVEEWRTELGGWMYEGVAASAAVNIDAPDSFGSAEPMYPPQELDGQPPIRGWEAVASSYFLARSEAELNSNIPPADFRRAYCLYDPEQPVNEQAAENDQGCSPRKTWDEWDLVSTGVITQVWGIELPVAVGISLPIVQEHPENRELGIRQAQAGVARLALGPLVALYPVLEANISLMLALSAAILYLTLPVMLLFGFFVATEPLVRQLLLRVVSVMLNTIILNGLIALFLLLLMNASLNGSLTGYLGVVGVAVIGGIILSRVAAGTETPVLRTETVVPPWPLTPTVTTGPAVSPTPTPLPQPALGLTVSTDTVRAGQVSLVTWRLTFTNPTPLRIGDLTVRDLLPPGLLYLAAEASQGLTAVSPRASGSRDTRLLLLTPAATSAPAPTATPPRPTPTYELYRTSDGEGEAAATATRPAAAPAALNLPTRAATAIATARPEPPVTIELPSHLTLADLPGAAHVPPTEVVFRLGDLPPGARAMMVIHTLVLSDAAAGTVYDNVGTYAAANLEPGRSNHRTVQVVGRVFPPVLLPVTGALLALVNPATPTGKATWALLLALGGGVAVWRRRRRVKNKNGAQRSPRIQIRKDDEKYG